jgi:uncharacterized membrane protein YwaF
VFKVVLTVIVVESRSLLHQFVKFFLSVLFGFLSKATFVCRNEGLFRSLRFWHIDFSSDITPCVVKCTHISISFMGATESTHCFEFLFEEVCAMATAWHTIVNNQLDTNFGCLITPIRNVFTASDAPITEHIQAL